VGYTGRMSHPRIPATALALLIAGVVVVAVASSVLATAVGWALVGVAVVVLVSYVFLLVGESEDRDRIEHPRG
jgi:hypothetical protein